MNERRVKKVKNGHYVATHGRLTPDPPYVHSNRGYSTDGEESNRAPSERIMFDYTVADEISSPYDHYNTSRKSRFGSEEKSRVRSPDRHSHHQMSHSKSPANASGRTTSTSWLPPRAVSALSYDHGGDAGSDIYVTSAVYKAPSEISRYSLRPSSRAASRSVYSASSTPKPRRTARGAKIETMSAPNPFCPNVKGVCCLILLLNLGLILVTLGFVVVVQFFELLYVWVLGIVFLVFGFLTLIGCMVYCVYVCKDAKTPSQIQNEDLYWTRHWQKNIGYTPQEIIYKADKYDAYSDRHSVSKMSGKYSDRESNRY